MCRRSDCYWSEPSLRVGTSALLRRLNPREALSVGIKSRFLLGKARSKEKQPKTSCRRATAILNPGSERRERHEKGQCAPQWVSPLDVSLGQTRIASLKWPPDGLQLMESGKTGDRDNHVESCDLRTEGGKFNKGGGPRCTGHTQMEAALCYPGNKEE